MPSTNDVVIVGAGIIGSSIAYHLVKRGVSCVLVEKDGIASQASGRAWALVLSPAHQVLGEGGLVPRGSWRPALSFVWDGFFRFPALARELEAEAGIDIAFRYQPTIRPVYSEDDEQFFKERLTELEREGIFYEFRKRGFEAGWLDAAETRARVPDVSRELRGAVVLPCYVVSPYRYTLALAQAAERRGATIRLAEATGLRTRGSRVTAVALVGGDIEGEVIVLAMGPWSSRGTSWLGREIPVKVIREQCLRLAPPRPFPAYTLTLDRRVGLVPRVDGSVIVGRVLWHDDEVDYDDRPTEHFKVDLLHDVITQVPMLEQATVIEHRAGLTAWAPRAPDHERPTPLLGRLPDWDNAYVAMRLGTTGITYGAEVGRRMADLIATGHSEDIPEILTPAAL